MRRAWNLARAATAILWAGDLAHAAQPPTVPFGDHGEISICSDTIIRVTHRPTASSVKKTSLVARADWAPVHFTVRRHGDLIMVETARLQLELSASTGRVRFRDLASKRLLLSEAEHSFMPVQDMGRDTYQVEQSWESSPSEGLYGGGSYQNGILNYKHAPVQMIQFNTEAVVPFFQSTEGYGLFWDNYAWTYLNPPKKAIVEPGSPSKGSVMFVPETDGDHFVFVGKAFPKPGEIPTWGAPGPNSGTVNVSLVAPDGRAIQALSWDGLANTPASLTGRAPALKRGWRYTVQYSWNVRDVGLFVQGPEYGRTTLRSFLGDLIDYYFVFGDTADGAVAGYRELTGAAPLYASWAYGFWQCKEHYDSQVHLLEAAREFRHRSIPVDAIVQDWLYWGALGWGPHWDPKAYPDPGEMVRELHSLSFRFMVSVWSRFDAKTDFFRSMRERGWTLGTSGYYDAWNPQARRLFYNFSKAAHFSIGVDSLWLDATEPEKFPNVNAKTFLGSGNAYMNTYSLQTTQAIADGLRRDYPSAQGLRVFSLTRSSFAGQQRTGAALWSGDISASWDSLRRQIAASLNYQMAGIPYWSEDIGGFFRPKDQYKSLAYHDLLIRWFQFGAFTPIFRVHGAGTATELWNFGESTMKVINVSAIGLRYRLLPYTYSGFARVEFASYTMQRALVMDFPQDRRTWSVADEFMWGDAFLVAPLLAPADPDSWATTRGAYLPVAASWVNFHTGAGQASGEAEVTFKLDEAPVFVRAGSVVPLGPLRQHVQDGAPDPLEVRVYPGADARFSLFEDDGTSRDYQRGLVAAVDFVWDDEKSELSIGARQGSFPGMLENRTFHVVRVAPGRGCGVGPGAPDAVVRYSGQAVLLRLPGGQITFL